MVAGMEVALISLALTAAIALGNCSGKAVQPKLGAVSTLPAAGSVIKSPNKALTAPSPRP